MTGVALSMVELLEIAADRIPHLRGIKFTHGDLMDYQRCRAASGGQYEIAWGADEMLLGALAVGATSAVGSTYNYAAPLYGRMIKAFRAGDLETARQYSMHAVELVAVLLKHGVLRTGKAVMQMVGLNCGPTRTPVAEMSSEEATTVRGALERIGFFDWVRR
jgi:N-acetylneuraminate lyase